MRRELLWYIANMNDYLAENWDQFIDAMNDKGLTEEEVDRLNGELEEYLTDNGGR